MELNPPQPDRGRLIALAWGAFVCCSWTWCIGMYLPVLMYRDFGPTSWFVFMLPNVIGAAAMGWMLHKPGAAAKLTRAHWPAAAAFSLVTVLFQVFFIGWIVRALIGNAAILATAAASAGIYFCGRRGHRDLIVAAALFVFSFAAYCWAASLPHLGPTGMSGHNVVGLFWLSPVVVFGFLLCPYLDLTFLRARASTDSPTGIAAFTIGFGILFVVMLLFTLWYAPYLQPGGLQRVPRLLAWIVAGHMSLQASYTIALHTRALAEDRCARQRSVVAAFFAVIAVTLLLGAWGDHILPIANAGEIIYRLFMAFYGLIFPAYVWIYMIPAKKGAIVLDGRRHRIFALTVLIAAPMFWMGFIQNRMVWLCPGLAVVLLSRVAIYRVAGETTAK